MLQPIPARAVIVNTAGTADELLDEALLDDCGRVGSAVGVGGIGVLVALGLAVLVGLGVAVRVTVGVAVREGIAVAVGGITLDELLEETLDDKDELDELPPASSNP